MITKPLQISHYKAAEVVSCHKHLHSLLWVVQPKLQMSIAETTPAAEKAFS